MSSTEELAALAAAAGLPQARLEAFAALPPAQLGALRQAIVRAEQKQARDLDAAIEGALSHIPLLLRGAVKKVLLG